MPCCFLSVFSRWWLGVRVAGLVLATGLAGTPGQGQTVQLPTSLDQLKALNPKNLLADKSVTLSGGLTARAINDWAWGIDARRIPQNYMLAGTMNLNFFGKFNIPIGLNLTNQNISLSNPFNQAYRFALPVNRFVFTPAYKGFRLQTGAACSVSFSPYTLAGHRFNGAALTYQGKAPIYGGIVWGVFNPAVRIDTTGTNGTPATSNNRPAYRRTGWGGQLGYKHANNKYELILFSATDQLSSLPYTLDSLRISPWQNAVISLNIRQGLGQHLTLLAEAARSALTTDTRAPERLTRPSLLDRVGGLLTANASTTFRNALHANLAYQQPRGKLALDVSRVDPDYRSLGTYYVNNDLQTLALQSALQLLGGRLSLTLDVGHQTDNLDGTKLQSASRWVSAASATYLPTPKTVLLASYSSFASVSNLRSQFDYLTAVSPYQGLDTLGYRQINQNLTLVGSAALPSSSTALSRSLSVNLLVQGSTDQQGGNRHQTQLVNASAGYSSRNSAAHRSVLMGLMGGYSQLSSAGDWLVGPSLSGTQELGRDQWLKSRLLVNYTLALPAGQPATRVLNARGGLETTVGGQHRLSLDVVYLGRGASARTDRYQPAFSELTTTVSYAWQFSVKVVK